MNFRVLIYFDDETTYKNYEGESAEYVLSRALADKINSIAKAGGEFYRIETDGRKALIELDSTFSEIVEIEVKE